jgi:hypothetical protein
MVYSFDYFLFFFGKIATNGFAATRWAGLSPQMLMQRTKLLLTTNVSASTKAPLLPNPC